MQEIQRSVIIRHSTSNIFIYPFQGRELYAEADEILYFNLISELLAAFSLILVTIAIHESIRLGKQNVELLKLNKETLEQMKLNNVPHFSEERLEYHIFNKSWPTFSVPNIGGKNSVIKEYSINVILEKYWWNSARKMWQYKSDRALRLV